MAAKLLFFINVPRPDKEYVHSAISHPGHSVQISRQKPAQSRLQKAHPQMKVIIPQNSHTSNAKDSRQNKSTADFSAVLFEE
ncbi:MAG: hypothetical protein JXM70_29975 [Pirellulales bacterium]|nr:hypothetical protein [Pirellulales bacterium]